jgi:hypothetical protein
MAIDPFFERMYQVASTGDYKRRSWLVERLQSYVLAIPKNQCIGLTQRADAVVASWPAEWWRCLSVGEGSQGGAPLAAQLDGISSHRRLIHAMSNIMNRRVLTAADLPLSHSFHVKTFLYTVVIVTTLPGESNSTFR